MSITPGVLDLECEGGEIIDCFRHGSVVLAVSDDGNGDDYYRRGR